MPVTSSQTKSKRDLNQIDHFDYSYIIQACKKASWRAFKLEHLEKCSKYQLLTIHNILEYMIANNSYYDNPECKLSLKERNVALIFQRDFNKLFNANCDFIIESKTNKYRMILECLISGTAITRECIILQKGTVKYTVNFEFTFSDDLFGPNRIINIKIGNIKIVNSNNTEITNNEIDDITRIIMDAYKE